VSSDRGRVVDEIYARRLLFAAAVLFVPTPFFMIVVGGLVPLAWTLLFFLRGAIVAIPKGTAEGFFTLGILSAHLFVIGGALYALSALLGLLLPRALAELAGVALPTAGAPPTAATSDEAEVFASLLADLTGVVLPALPAATQGRARGVALLLLHLQAADRFGSCVREAERALLARALGRDEPDPLRARALLAARIEAASPAEDADWLRLFAALGAQRIALWPFLGGLAAKPLAALF